jgi:hypothetical protein
MLMIITTMIPSLYLCATFMCINVKGHDITEAKVSQVVKVSFHIGNFNTFTLS